MQTKCENGRLHKLKCATYVNINPIYVIDLIT